jgi:nucleoside-diphosphate-sugar epimerase
MKQKVLITGAAGYVGSVLRRGLLRNPDIEIVNLDVRPPEEPIGAREHWIIGDVTADSWHEEARRHGVTAVVHLAFVLREPYGNRRHQRRVNVEGTRLIRDFALTSKSVRRLIYFSSISIFADRAPRGMEVPLGDDAGTGTTPYGYAADKIEAERCFADEKLFAEHDTRCVVVRPASISGPYGRFERRRFGLISTLTAWSPFVFGGSAAFGRQFLHEEDVVGIVDHSLGAPTQDFLNVFNAAPDDYLDLASLGAILRRRVLILPPWLLRVAFWIAWHGSRGKIPTSPGAWIMLTFPHRVSGDGLTRRLGYIYRAKSQSALNGAAAKVTNETPRSVFAVAEKPQTAVPGDM